jgi:general secretion pathway protein I
MAHLVAVNKLHQLRLVVANARELQPLRDNGEERLAERDWFWWVEVAVAPGGLPDFYRVEISVALDPDRQDQPLYELVAFMSGDLREEESPPPDTASPDEPIAPDPDPSPDPDPTPPGAPDEAA